MAEWSLLSLSGQVLVCVAEDPNIRLRDIAARLDITERTAFGIIKDLTDRGYLIIYKEGRRTRYEVQRDDPHIQAALEMPTDIRSNEAGA